MPEPGSHVESSVQRNKFLPLPVGYRVSLENDGKRYLLEIDQRDKGPLFKVFDSALQPCPSMMTCLHL